MASDAKDLKAVLDVQQKRDLAPNVISNILSEMKSTMIFQFSWEELLQSSPTAISCMGAFFTASAFPKSAINLTPPKGQNFKYLKYSSAQANVVECGNMGRMAFVEAGSSMGHIQQTSSVVLNKTNNVIQLLGDPMSAKKMLRPEIQSIQAATKQCLDTSIKMDKKFEEWLLLACELHAACVEQQVTTHDQALSNEVALAVEQIQLSSQQPAAEDTKRTSEMLGKQAVLASEAFQKASSVHPPSWDIAGQPIVGDLVNVLTTALNQAVLAITQNVDSISKIEATAPPKAIQTKAADPAYAQVNAINIFLSALNAIINGKDGNVDWDMAMEGQQGANSSLNLLKTIFEHNKNRFTSIAIAAEPSQTLKTVLEVCSKITADLVAEVEKANGIRSSLPTKDSDQVKKWQSEFSAQYQKAQTLIATARSLPGSTANGIPLMADTDSMARMAQLDAKTIQGQAVLDSAKNRVITAPAAFTISQNAYTQSTGVLSQQQSKIGNIEANLTKSTASDLTLTEIKAILIEGIKLIISLKQQMRNLVRSIKAMETIINVLVSSHVEPFLQTVKLLAQDGNDPNANTKIGDYTLTDLQRTQVFMDAITIRSYFGYFGDVARSWTQISMETIMPGLRMCDEMSFPDDNDPRAAKQRFERLQSWSKDASDRVSKFVLQKQQPLRQGMQDRIDASKGIAEKIEAPPASTLKAITDGIDISKAAAQDYIDEKAKQSPFDRFAISANGQ